MSRPPETDRVTVPMPTSTTSFLRRFLPWQLWRFVWINVRMLRMIALSHPHEERP